MTDPLTLYIAKVCPFAHRVELALAEANAKYTRFEVDLKNKPEWYARKINPASKVPAVVYGGPPAPPDDPHPAAARIAESLVLLEFVADLYSEAGLLPTDPVLRAKARFFIDAVSTKVVPPWVAYIVREGDPVSGSNLLAGLEHIQSLLPPEGYAIVQHSIADIALAPFIVRMQVAFENDSGAFGDGEGIKMLDTLRTPKYARFQQYVQDVIARPSLAATYDKEAHAAGAAARRAEKRSSA